MTVDVYEVVLLAAGLMVLVAAWLPGRLADRPMSLPIVLVLLGAVVFSLPIGFESDRVRHAVWFERATELVVIVSLMAAGLKLDRPIGWRSWATTWRLLAIGMPITIAIVTVAGLAAGVPLGGALLLAAALAPTDPVLAADVQVGEPSTGSDANDAPAEDEVRFALTSEAGLNDGFAFPFVYAAMAIASAGNKVSWSAWWHWIGIDLLARVGAGVAAGAIIGKLLSRVIFGEARRTAGLAATATGFVALAATLLAYGSAELIHGYGFVAVFVTAVTIRGAERTHEYLNVLHDFADEIEQLLVVAVLVLFGGALATGLLAGLDFATVAIAVACVFVARPLACTVAMWRGGTPQLERRLISFFGIRGVGSLYYLAYAARREDFEEIDRIWAAVAATVLLSIVVHGVVGAPAMRRLDRRLAARMARRVRTPDPGGRAGRRHGRLGPIDGD